MGYNIYNNLKRGGEMMGWSKWFGVGSGEKTKEKTTKTSDGGTKYESLRTNEGNKSDHQHTWVIRDKSSKIKGGGATPGKKR
ncbi:hypothetical protein KKB71_02110 [Patescibacteria group bacterium]|nr:hypothetical protein [Patescibacteria group bacterium]